MRTKEYDVNFNGGRLTVVRLKDGATVADAEIPAEATDAVVAVLSTPSKTETPTVKKSEETESEEKPKKTTKTKTKKTENGSVQTT